MQDMLDAATRHGAFPTVILTIVADVVIRVGSVVVVLFRKGDRPQVATAWVVLLLTLPFVGIVAYLIFGET